MELLMPSMTKPKNYDHLEDKKLRFHTMKQREIQRNHSHAHMGYS